MTDRNVPRRLPARVYWVRRFVVLGLPLLLVVLLVWWLTGRGGDDARAAAPSASPTAGQEAPAAAPTTPAAQAADGLPPECAPEQLGLAVSPGGETFTDGAEPTFEVSIENTGTEPCLVDAGDASREVLVTSGSDRVWSSRDCLPAEVPERTLLLAGGQADVTQLAWPRVRSAEGCPDGLPAPGDGTYSATVTVGGATSPAAVFGLG
ncbi:MULTISPECIES: hypothetical protein [Cellulomonas]|uniref:hypothetical protein n=1 Tax=Cellulomonas TaxID=1707 RepID=UPI0010A89417|nr:MULTISPECIES: hypothetical protein [Cellulomonas]